jgi:dTDP-glucose pyrophosphorylase
MHQRGREAPSRDHRFIFVCLKEHIARYRIDETLRALAPGAEVASLGGVTQGAACTVLEAREFFEGDDPLMIVNSDQWVDVEIDAYLEAQDRSDVDGLIMTMWSDDPKWSYARFDTAGRVTGVVEKQVVSNAATVGIYNFRRGRDFANAADSMLRKELRVNGEFYVAPTYNELIRAGKLIATYPIGKEFDGMYGLGTPGDLERFLSLDVSQRATAPPARR